jgi:hypothetical protein
MKSLLATTAILLSVGTAAAVELGTQPNAHSPGGVEWTGFAASPNGRVFQTDYNSPTEEGARMAARALCERATARTCASTISVPNDFDVVAVSCGGRVFFGASKLGLEEAAAFDKAARAGFVSCRVVARY